MAAETPTGFTIDGRIYETPENLTAAEHRIIKRYTGLNFRELSERSGEDLMNDQDVLVATMHIAYRRDHRDLSFEEIEDLIGEVDLEVAMETLSGDEGDARPPDTTSEHDESSPNGEAESSKSSGTGSRKSLDPSGPTLATTGTTE